MALEQQKNVQKRAQQVADLQKAAASMNEIDFDPIAAQFTDRRNNPVKVTKVWGPKNFVALAFQCPLNVDFDGSSTCYAPPDSALQHDDDLRWARSDTPPATWRWVGLIALTHDDAVRLGVDIDERDDAKDAHGTLFPLKDADGKYPVKQRLNGRLTGYYVSTTATSPDPALLRREPWNPGAYWNSQEVRYGALSGGLKDLGVRMGDFGLIIRKSTGASSHFFFADAGSDDGPHRTRVGECSARIWKDFDRNNEIDDCFLVFPGSGPGGAVPGIQTTSADKVRKQMQGFAEAGNRDLLALFLALGADLQRYRETIRQAVNTNRDARLLVNDYTKVMTALRKGGYWPPIGDFPTQNLRNGPRIA
jgi:hypothetical protein